jgi:hypothetical protein
LSVIGEARRIELQDDRWQRTRRQPPQVGHRQVRNHRDVGVGIRARLKIDFDDADTRQRSGFHVIDAAAQREEPFEPAGNLGFDFLRRHAVIEGGDDDLRDVDRRKQVDRHADHAGNPDHRDEQAADDDQVRVADGESRHSGSFSDTPARTRLAP